MKKLTASHFNDAMAYALLEPEFNLFLIGDLEKLRSGVGKRLRIHGRHLDRGNTPLRYSGLQEQFPVLQPYRRLQ